ncbi:TonB-dependent receptor domain-containing protein [Massilia sp. NR 4-1]|uniref:TonB-dependent receptor domain-containing protein n=1 Tax=Massilia sp. NR 4-1 TaxID=1678028 RepID=UPI001237905B
MKQESAKTAGLGARYAGKQWKLEGAAFNLSFSNQIVYVNTPPVYYKNLGKTSRRGIETRTGYAFERGGALAGLRADATYAYTKAMRNKGYIPPMRCHSIRAIPIARDCSTRRLGFDLNTTHQPNQYADDANTVAERANGALGLILPPAECECQPAGAGL